MIRNSFIFLERVGKRKERSIWNQVKDWTDFLKRDVNGISSQKKEYYNRKIQEAQQALREEDVSYFVGKLPQVEMWRLYEYFKEETCFVDIEVDSYGRIVVVGVSNYYDTNFFVRGVNLEMVEKELAKYKVIVTFNGGAFDIPKLRKMNVTVHHAHIDLKPLCVNLGMKGGLKEIEKKLNLNRPSHLYGNPVDLWQAFHASGDREYLDLLLDYNREDCENLKGVMEYCYRELSKNI